MRKLPVFSLSAALMCIAVGGAGCESVEQQRHSYLLDVEREERISAIHNDKIAVVEEFDVSPRFRDKSLVYRTGKFRYESDYYNEFLTGPGRLISEETRKWLAGSGIFGSVLKYGEVPDPTYVVKGEVTELYGDFSEESGGRAVMGIRFLLVDFSGEKSKIVFEKDYHCGVGLDKRSAENLIEAQNECLRRILRRLEDDLKAVVSR